MVPETILFSALDAFDPALLNAPVNFEPILVPKVVIFELISLALDPTDLNALLKGCGILEATVENALPIIDVCCDSPAPISLAELTTAFLAVDIPF